MFAATARLPFQNNALRQSIQGGEFRDTGFRLAAGMADGWLGVAMASVSIIWEVFILDRSSRIQSRPFRLSIALNYSGQAEPGISDLFTVPGLCGECIAPGIVDACCARILFGSLRQGPSHRLQVYIGFRLCLLGSR
jgi:hypothetical protein